MQKESRLKIGIVGAGTIAGIHALAIVLAIYRSLNSGLPVNMDELLNP